jgi:hypothetical protein
MRRFEGNHPHVGPNRLQRVTPTTETPAGRRRQRRANLRSHLVPLATAAVPRYREAVELRDVTLATPVGTFFELHERIYQRSETRRVARPTAYVVQQARDARLGHRIAAAPSAYRRTV